MADPPPCYKPLPPPPPPDLSPLTALTGGSSTSTQIQELERNFLLTLLGCVIGIPLLIVGSILLVRRAETSWHEAFDKDDNMQRVSGGWVARRIRGSRQTLHLADLGMFRQGFKHWFYTKSPYGLYWDSLQTLCALTSCTMYATDGDLIFGLAHCRALPKSRSILGRAGTLLAPTHRPARAP
jgi:hypothetical protein